MSEVSMRRRLSSPALAAPLPDDDDLLREILLRLPPLPSSLPRASLVSKRWRRMLSDPHFLRRFRAFHHRQAPLLGFCTYRFGSAYFTPMLDPPDRIPSARLSLALPPDEDWGFLGCRHGLALLINRRRLEITVWDPVTGDQRCVALPPGLNSADPPLVVRGSALLCEDHAGLVPIEAFKVVLLRTDDVLPDADPHAFAFLYESKAGTWSNVISTSITGALYDVGKPGILVGDSVHWFLIGYMNNSGILEFDLDRRNLAEIGTPPDAPVTYHSQILRMEDGNLGFAVLSELSIQVWERKANSKGGAIWMLQKTIKLDSLLSLKLTTGRSWIVILGYDEDGNFLFVSTDLQVFRVQLKSLQFKSLSEINIMAIYHPYTSFYTSVRGTGSGDVGAEALNNT